MYPERNVVHYSLYTQTKSGSWLGKEDSKTVWLGYVRFTILLTLLVPECTWMAGAKLQL